jgi:hypothetical protein
MYRVQTRCGFLRGKTLILFALLLLPSIPYLYTVMLARTSRSAAELLDGLSDLSSLPDSAYSYSYKQGSSFLLSLRQFESLRDGFSGSIIPCLSRCFRDHSVSESRRRLNVVKAWSKSRCLSWNDPACNSCTLL